MNSNITYYSYPLTQRPPPIADDVAEAFRAHEEVISTRELSQDDSLSSDDVLETVRPDLEVIGFDVEDGKRDVDKVTLPATFGEAGRHDHEFDVDGFHEREGCVLEVEAGRAWDSNHVHRNLIRSMTLPGVELLVMAVPHEYKHSNGTSPAFDKARDIADALYRTDRVGLPFGLVLLGY